jgi:DNA-binding IclR family transcriptional regulator
VTVKTVDTSLELLDRLARSSEPLGVADLSRELALPKSNVFRLLATLVKHGFVKQREDTRYEPSLKLWELGSMVVSRSSLTQVARPVLEDLAAATGESAQLAVLDRVESIYIDKREGPHPISGFTRIGTRAPAHCCATGKVELAFRTPEALEELPEKLAHFTAATVRTRKALAQELAGIRASGVAVNRGEWVDDVWGVAAAIRNHTGTVCASIGVWGPRQRISSVLEATERKVRSAADRISTGLGCPPGFLSPTERSHR